MAAFMTGKKGPTPTADRGLDLPHPELATWLTAAGPSFGKPFRRDKMSNIKGGRDAVVGCNGFVWD